MKLLLVDDHALFREALRALLGKVRPDVTVVEAATLEDAVAQCRDTRFRVVLLDLGLAASDGLETLRAFREALPEVPVVVLSGDRDGHVIRDAIEQGAVGYVPKSHTTEQMVGALRLVVSGGVYLPPEALQVEAAPAAVNDGGRFQLLSPRQLEVARLLLQGKTNKAIARELGLSEGTVKAHVSAIYQVVGARNRVDAVTLAARWGFIVIV